MIIFKPYSSSLSWFTALLFSALAAGCGGGGEGRSPILGTAGIAVLVPTVTAVAPANNATGVAINTVVVGAFSTDMAATSIPLHPSRWHVPIPPLRGVSLIRAQIVRQHLRRARRCRRV